MAPWVLGTARDSVGGIPFHTSVWKKNSLLLLIYLWHDVCFGKSAKLNFEDSCSFSVKILQAKTMQEMF